MAVRMKTRTLCEYLKPKLSIAVLVNPGKLPDMPNRCIAIQMGTGPGEEMEGLFDIITFQVSCRGGENNLDDAEDLAGEVDNIFTGRAGFSSENVLVGTELYVSQFGRTGSGPSQLTLPDAQSRYTFTCNYFANVATGIGMVTS